MMDLLQLASLQVFPQELMSKSETVNEESSPSQVAFVAIMAHLMSEKEELEPDNVKNVDSALQTPIDARMQAVLDKEEDGALKEIRSENEELEAIDSTIEENISLTWINAASYEPPKVKAGEIKQNDADAELAQQASPLQFAQPDCQEPVPPPNQTQLPIEEQAQLLTIEQKNNSRQLDNENLENIIQTQASVEEQEFIQIPQSGTRVTEHIPEMPERQPILREELMLQMEDKEQGITETLITSQGTESSLPGESEVLPIAPSSINNTANPVPAHRQVAPLVQTALELSQAVDTPEWSEQFNQQILWLGQQKINSAIIKLNPEELGPLEVVVRLVKDSASVNITTHTNQIRELIEQAIPRLRDMMTEQGVNLSQVNIESNANYRQASQQHNGVVNLPEPDSEEEVVIDSTPIKLSKGLVDYFA